MAELLFAYGTLRPSLWPESLRAMLASVRCVDHGSVWGRLYDLGSHPAAILDNKAARRVFGEVLSLPDGSNMLPQLDDYEGPDYDRVTCSVRLSTGNDVACWIYVYNRDPSELVAIPQGDYVSYKLSKVK